MVRKFGCFLILALGPVSVGGQSFVNFETPQVHPVDLSPDGTRLLVVNTADNRLEVFDVTGAAPLHLGDVPVGLDPVSVRAYNDQQAWVVNQISDTVSIVDLTAMNVIATLRTADEPADVIFAGQPVKAFVTCSQVNAVQVFNPTDLVAPPVEIPINGEDPRALAVSPDGNTVYVAIFESGNATTILAGGATDSRIAFPPNAVNHPDGPYGGVNPPPNKGNKFEPPINPGLPPPPRVGLIVRKDENGNWMDDNGGDWTEWVTGAKASLSGRLQGWDMPDRDVAAIDANSLQVAYIHRLMNICMAVAVNPATGKVAVVGTEALNQIRYEPNITGVFIRVNLALAEVGGNPPSIHDLNPHLKYKGPRVEQSKRDRSLGDPRGILFNAAGTRAYVTGKGSNNIIVVDSNGDRVGNPLDLGEGPTGLALSADGKRLYVLNGFEASLSIIEGLSQDALVEVDRVPLAFDPTPGEIRFGRKHLYDTHLNSGHGHIACGSCHVDGRMDRLGWDLGNPAGEMKPFNQNCLNGLEAGCRDFHPMKGPMSTQTLQDIIGKEPHHWRGDRDGLEEFAGAFEGLQGDDEPLPPAEMQQFEDFLGTIHFPPNPYRNFDNTLPADLPLPGHYSDGRFAGVGGLKSGDPLPNGNAQRALPRYRTGLIDGGTISCVTCHSLPTGMGSNLIRQGSLFVDFPTGPNGEKHHALTSQDGSTNISIKIPQTRNVYDKVGYDLTQLDNRAGFGFLHDGSVDSIARFVSEPVFLMRNDQEVADFVALMLAFSGSDLPVGNTTNPFELRGPDSQDAAAAVGRQVTVDENNKESKEVKDLITAMVTEADKGKVSIVVKGVQNGEARGYAFLGSDRFQSDRADEIVKTKDLRLSAGDGSELTFTVVPLGTQVRIGIDRDEDGFFDRDEIDACKDPADPKNRPGKGVTGNFDGDEDVDLDDYRELAACFAGPGVTAASPCRCAFDFDGDRDVDLADAREFANLFTGAK